MRIRGTFVAQLLSALLAAASVSLCDLAPRAGAQGAGAPAQQPAPQTRDRRVDARPAPQATPQTLATPPASPTPAADDEEVLSVETSLVNVLFNAVDRDRRFVTTLRQEDVRVFENDAPQVVSVFQRETDLPVSLAVLVDVSWSQKVTLPDEAQAAGEFVDAVLRPNKDRAAVVSFTGTATVEQDLTSDRAALHRAIASLRVVPPADKDEAFVYQEGEKAEVVPEEVEQYGLPGSTALWDSVWATATDLMSATPENTRRAIIILSDGDDTTSRVKKEDAIDAALKANTIIYSIGVEPICEEPDADCHYEKGALRKVSERTGGRAFFPEDEQQLRAAFAEINQELRTQYLVAYSPTNKARDNTYRRIRIEIINPRLRDQKIKLTYREGYFAAPPAAVRPKPARAPQERLKRPPRRPRKK
ncbi:MAG TPA: VWA domain-containing protein [Pyrinomonadaceae bacterium]|jgi:VWFA-related protein|nr:VWA domain-containing protein [Pyrinomonadaceae bacterium]